MKRIDECDGTYSADASVGSGARGCGDVANRRSLRC